MIKRQYIKSRQVSKVTFMLPKAEMPEGIVPESVQLAGDFNNWDPTATPMKPNSKGDYRATIELEPGRTYQFRYLVNNVHWCNDWHADAYIANGLGVDNCVLETPSARK